MPVSGPPAAAPPMPSAAVATSALRWVHLVERVRACFWLKAFGTPTFMLLFFVGYFHLLRHPTQPAFEMPLTAIDHWIGFQPWALWPYVSLWVYVALPPALLPNARELIRFGWWIGGLCLAGLACFYLWPTAVPRPVVNIPPHAGFELLHGVDAAGNACPSLHVAAAIFSALWLDRLLRNLAMSRWLRVASVSWFVLIVWSTLAVKQHVWWDIVAGLLLGLAVALPSLHLGGARRQGYIMAP